MAIGDGHSAGYGVILKISLLSVTISKPGGGDKMAHERQKDEGGARSRNTANNEK
jgi:hypothetical protein